MLPKRKSVRIFPPQKERSAETTWNGLVLTTTPIPCPSALLRRGKVYLFKIWLDLLLCHSGLVGELVVFSLSKISFVSTS